MTDMQRDATFSECRTYRWTLSRWWENTLPPCVFIGLNPSTADETEDDPTIRRCIGFAKSWGMGGLMMLNAFAFLATDPKVMQAADDPIGDENDHAIAHQTYIASRRGGIIIAAWGNHCPDSRQKAICNLVNGNLQCLGKTQSGKPKHPLYIASKTKPIDFAA